MTDNKVTKVGDVCEITSSKRIFANEYIESGIPFYRGKEITEKYKGNLNISTELFISEEKYEEIKAKHGVPETGDMLLTSVGTLGSTYIVRSTDKFYFKDGNLTWFRRFNGLNSLYLKYWLDSPDGKAEIKKSTIGSSQSALTIANLKSMQIALPSIENQEKIAQTLFNYDSLIENNNRRIATLEEMAQSLHREWFVKFRFPGHENTKLIDSLLGKIPEGWEVKTLKDILELAYGKALKKDDRNGGDVAVYGSGGICGYHNKALVEGPRIIVGRKGNVGSVFWSESDVWPIDTVFYVKSDVSYYFLYYNLLGQTFHNSDAAVPGLNRESAYSNKIVIPSRDILSEFDELIKPIFKFLKVLIQKVENLKSQRDLLLPKLISGSLKLDQ
jgi:type I restriction enzyme S subunit